MKVVWWIFWQVLMVGGFASQEMWAIWLCAIFEKP